MKELKITDNLQKTMEERYYQPNEKTPQEVVRRVADWVASGEKLFGYDDKKIKALSDKYFNGMNQRKWMASSPFLINAGTKLPMVSACFLIGDLHDDMNAIFDTLHRSATISKLGGGCGFNFSRLREEGSPIGSTGGTSSGVMSYMELFDAVGETIKQGGKRRCANIGILRYNHPEILKFIDYKLNLNKLNNFNISVLVNNEFMEKVEKNEEYDLISPKDNKVVGKLNAREVFNKIMQNNHKSAEPALLFEETINIDNPMREFLGNIIGCNACGEIVMYFNECCMLASINVGEFVSWDGIVDYQGLREITADVTRFLDTAIDIQIYPDERIEKKVKSLRRIGVGIMGLHEALIKKGLKYSSPEGRKFASELMEIIQKQSLKTSEELAEEKGTFPLYEKSTLKRKRRNVNTTTIPPTGTISMIVNCSSACEPIFAYSYVRMINEKPTYWMNDFLIDFAKEKGFWNDTLPELIQKNKGSVKGIDLIPLNYQEMLETAQEINPLDHVKMQSSLQKYVDNSISKTTNMPSTSTVEDVANVYMTAWKLGCKGTTVYVDGSRDSQVLSTGEVKKENKNNYNTIQPVSRTSIGKTYGTTTKYSTACGSFYLTINRDKNNNIVESFVNVSKNGTCKSNIDGLNRMISLALRSGTKVDEIVDQLRGISCSACTRVKTKGDKKIDGISCPDIIARALEEEYKSELSIKKSENKVKKVKPEVKSINKNQCPECGEPLMHEGGCVQCMNCSYSKCN